MDYEIKASKRVARIMLGHLRRTYIRVTPQPDGSVMFNWGNSDVCIGVNRVNDWAHVDVTVMCWDVDPTTGMWTEIGGEQRFYSIADYGCGDYAQIAEIARNL